ncbi:Helix-turn-helix domain-containing protein [Paracoccus alcaliphilus]|uniref:Helix-turn-helix domain-containing protein n=1 Tax=Paracoccus alcaliphilus TaxID=34002 RepID=A0A1H8GG62_9RHOB|nr:helix-turn-helix domain-containing protein [Paracoccus alcaliphilus]WCR17996.1 helix-turn-helix domain-containing protein [Paracoccus alcaliphilus]SEN42760.1 Helix-turn-helix domain-containing protein [Paracoccus alcaliphilus]
MKQETATLNPATVTVPRLMTQKEVSEYTRLSEKWFERDRWVGARIPYVKFGRLVRYRASDVAAFIEANLQSAK